jgi:ABC-2 type transport system permease protein
VINGKFLAGVFTISLMLLSIVLVISGFGLTLIGVVPGLEEIWRLLMYLVISIVYISFWLGLAILFSILFKSIATSALASVALWIFLSFFVSLGAEILANAVAPPGTGDEAQMETVARNARIKESVSLCSPMVLYSEASSTIIDPMRKTTHSIILMGPMERLSASRFQNPLPLGQSLIVVSPHLIALVAMTLICFAISYILFMLQEIRT